MFKLHKTSAKFKVTVIIFDRLNFDINLNQYLEASDKMCISNICGHIAKLSSAYLTESI